MTERDRMIVLEWSEFSPAARAAMARIERLESALVSILRDCPCRKDDQRCPVCTKAHEAMV